MAAEDLRRDLIFLNRNAGMFYGLSGEVTKKFAERFGAMERMAIDQALDFRQELGPVSQSDSGDIDVTSLYQEPHLIAIIGFN